MINHLATVDDIITVALRVKTLNGVQHLVFNNEHSEYLTTNIGASITISSDEMGKTLTLTFPYDSVVVLPEED